MITPIEIQGKVFKSGIGYDKKDVDGFLRDLLNDYEEIYRNNADLNENISSLEEQLSYYKSIEKTLQKALILAEKTAEETVKTANRESDLIIGEARLKAKSIVKDAKSDMENLHKQSTQLLQQYEVYKAQFKQIAKAQVELLESEAFEIQIANLSREVFNDEKTENEKVVEEVNKIVQTEATEGPNKEVQTDAIDESNKAVETDDADESNKTAHTETLEEASKDQLSKEASVDEAKSSDEKQDDYDIEFFSLGDE